MVILLCKTKVYPLITSEETIENGLLTSAGWEYTLDTRLIKDGTHSLLIMAIDKYGVEELYTSLINVDNTA